MLDRPPHILRTSVARYPHDSAAPLTTPSQGQRKEGAALEAEGRAMGLPEHIRLLPASPADRAAAAAVPFASASASGASSASSDRGAAAASDARFEAMRKLKRAAIRSSSIFSTPAERALPSGALLASAGGSRGAKRPASAGGGRAGKGAGSVGGGALAIGGGGRAQAAAKSRAGGGGGSTSTTKRIRSCLPSASGFSRRRYSSINREAVMIIRLANATGGSVAFFTILL